MTQQPTRIVKFPTRPQGLTREDWSRIYDAGLEQTQTTRAKRCAQALRQFLHDPNHPVLDIGCATGVSGAALTSEGFRCIDGADRSKNMLELALSTQIYRDLYHLPHMSGFPLKYRAFALIGVIGPSGEPLELLDRLLKVMPSNSKCVLAFNEQALGNPLYDDHIDGLLRSNTVIELLRESGDYLPTASQRSTVYLFEKL